MSTKGGAPRGKERPRARGSHRATPLADPAEGRRRRQQARPEGPRVVTGGAPRAAQRWAVGMREAARPSDAAPGAGATPLRGHRLISLDAFRGLTVFGMLLVNEKTFGPATPRQLAHAGWSGGVHLADMVFPWFLLIVGVAIPFAAASWGKRQTPAAYYLGLFRRAALLVLLGCVVNSSYAQRPLFDLGVLQLIGFAYLFGALLSGLPWRPRLAAIAGLLAAHWAVLRFFPVPAVGAGVFTPAGNAIAYLNRTYLEPYHLGGAPSVATTTALVLIGTLIGDRLLRAATERHTLRAMLLAGSGLVLGGWLWHFDLPFNKPIWTAPYVVFAAGWGTLVLAGLYWIIDLLQRPRWAFPLVVAGRNAIFVFTAPILVNLHVLREWHWGGGAGAPSLDLAIKEAFFSHLGRVPGGFVYTFAYIFLWWLVLYWMYRRRIFLRV